MVGNHLLPISHTDDDDGDEGDDDDDVDEGDVDDDDDDDDDDVGDDDMSGQLMVGNQHHLLPISPHSLLTLQSSLPCLPLQGSPISTSPISTSRLSQMLQTVSV